MKRYIFRNENFYNGCMMKVLNSIREKVLDYNWLVTDMETYFLDDEYLFLSTKELFDLIEKIMILNGYGEYFQQYLKNIQKRKY